MEHLIANAFDMHIHSGPDVLPRKIDDIDLAKRMADRGMAGYIIKDHYFNSAGRAALARKLYPNVHVTGSIALNSAVGINPVAVKLAAMTGAKLIWFPTTDAKHEQDEIFGPNAAPPEKLPFWVNVVNELRAQNIHCPPISILDEGGKLIDAAIDVLDIAAKEDMVVATSHISHAETFALAKAAKERKVQKLLITHVSFPSTFYTIAEQKELLACGAYLEQCYTTYSTGKVDFDTVAAQIRAAGCDRVVISTDLGQPTRMFPDEGMLEFSKDLLAKGFTEKEIHMMNGDTPRMLAGLK